jgi:bacterial/archaeal transporter family-2 protein
MNNTLFYLLALIAGMAVAAQGGINAQLRQAIASPVMAAFISCLIGALSILIYILIFEQSSFNSLPRLKSLSFYKLSGGLIGGFFVYSMVILAPRIGAANMLGLIVAGQMILAIILDHFGLLGFEQHTVNIYRLAGTFLLIIGVIFIVKN